jgi:hypothetical protein
LKAPLEGVPAALFYDIDNLFIVGYIFHGLSSSSFCHNFLEMVSKPQIASKDKARFYEKAQHTRVVCEHFEEIRNAAFGS